MNGRKSIMVSTRSPVLLAIVLVAASSLLTGCDLLLSLIKPPTTTTTSTSSSTTSTTTTSTTTTTTLAAIEMVSVPGGNFQMGSPAGSGQDDEHPTHTVTVTGFMMSTYEVTQARYQALTGDNPSYLSGSSLPVEQVTWFDAVEFCNKLSEQDGLDTVYTITNRTPSSGYPIESATVTMDISRNGYRLPTEAEWEYASRGGDGSPGGFEYAGSNDPDAVAWYWDNSTETTHPVGSKTQNGLGLFDLSGNVWEWCWDWYDAYSGTTGGDPTGPGSGTYRVMRGGSWGGDAACCRSAFRYNYEPEHKYSTIGFRVVRRP